MEAFIRTKGVTLCPPCLSQELVEHNLKKAEAWAAMTPKERWQAASPLRRRGRSSKLSPEEKKERQRERSNQWYARNKEKKAAYDRERRERKDLT